MIVMTSNVDKWRTTWGEYLKVFSGSMAQAVAKQSKEFSNAMYVAAKAASPPKGSIRAERLAAFKRGEGIKFHNTRIGGGVNEVVRNQEELLFSRLDKSTKWRSSKAKKSAKDARSRYLELKLAFEEAARRSNMSHGESVSHKMTIQALKAEIEIFNRESHRMFGASAWRFSGSNFNEIYRGGRVVNWNKDSKYPETNLFKIESKDDKTFGEFSMGTVTGKKGSGQIAAIYSSSKGHALIEAALRSTAANMREYITRKQREAAQAAARRAAASIR